MTGRCHQTEAVRQAAARGRWMPGLEGHLVVCAACRDVELVTRALATPLETQPLAVDPRLLWAKAQTAARLASAARMTRVLTMAQVLSAAAVVAVFALAVRWPDVAALRAISDTTVVWLTGGLSVTAATLWLSQSART
jgi:hypothetical protein